MTDPNSRKEVFERREHVADDAPMDNPEYLRDGEPWYSFWDSLAEAYAEGGVEIHLHFRAVLDEGGVAGEWCAVFNRTPAHEFDFVGCVVAGSDEAKGLGREKDEVRQSMLIHVVKLVEPPKGVGFGEPLPSRVRLQPLDYCLCAWVDAPEHVVEFARILLDENGESGVGFNLTGHRPLTKGDGEFKNEVVESAPEVVEAVSNYETEFGGRCVKHFNPHDLLAAVNIGFGPCSVRAFFDPGSTFGFKALQVIERSLEPPFVVEGHG
jgi:hypothetical protein